MVLPKKCEETIKLDIDCEVCHTDDHRSLMDDIHCDILMVFNKQTCIYGGATDQKEKFIVTQNIPFIRILSEFTSVIFTYRDFSEIFEVDPVINVE